MIMSLHVCVENETWILRKSSQVVLTAETSIEVQKDELYKMFYKESSAREPFQEIICVNEKTNWRK